MLVEVPVVRTGRPAAGTLLAVGGEQLIVQRWQVRRGGTDEVVHLQVMQADTAGLDAQQRLGGEVADQGGGVLLVQSPQHLQGSQRDGTCSVEDG